MTTAAAAADGPTFTPVSAVRLGGVDPLGLRQINFDLMDRVFPALNNVARHVRPFVVVAWACRRAAQLAANQGTDRIAQSDLIDFVNRIEVIYAWSQFLRNPDADLPGRQFLGRLLRADRWVFGGSEWNKLCAQRRDSTAFTAAITYGPSLKTLGWVLPHPGYPCVLLATDKAAPALDAFEAVIADRLEHPAFSRFGLVEVTSAEAREWSDAWALETATDAEKRVMANMLAGAGAPVSPRNGCELMIAASRYKSSRDAGQVRAAMTGAPSKFAPDEGLRGSLNAWRRVQVRQLFRLSLEALLYWIFQETERGAKPTETLVKSFLNQAGPRSLLSSAREWLNVASVKNTAPTELMARIEKAFNEIGLGSLVPPIIDGMAFCLAESRSENTDYERSDRLPLARARKEAEARIDTCAADFVRHVIESWVLAQHAYWSIGLLMRDRRENDPPIEGDPGGRRMDARAWRFAITAGAHSRPPANGAHAS